MQEQPILLSSLARACHSNFKRTFQYEQENKLDQIATSVKLDALYLADLLKGIQEGKVDSSAAQVRMAIGGHIAGILYRTLTLCVALRVNPLKLIEQREAHQV